MQKFLIDMSFVIVCEDDEDDDHKLELKHTNVKCLVRSKEFQELVSKFDIDPEEIFVSEPMEWDF